MVEVERDNLFIATGGVKTWRERGGEETWQKKGRRRWENEEGRCTGSWAHDVRHKLARFPVPWTSGPLRHWQGGKVSYVGG